MDEDKEIEQPKESSLKVEETEKKDDAKSVLENVKYKVVNFAHTHNYTTIAIGTGLLVGVGILVKHFIKRKK